ncbi:histidine kinase [Streptomyces sp. NBC_01381]|uniref:sensor histidine kinase n=1 Tax=Streptomyces sp. NBC_01381 TaxID=2903845 RepID=UPI002250D671|nr:histidine kinase [Streptomyces sp. NBC_01381]MCX4670958.1 histidine kinase [Streptomyces sp. NBC_01381]
MIPAKPRLPPFARRCAIEAAVLLLAGTDLLVELLEGEKEQPGPYGLVLTVLALAALPWRRRRPVLVLVLTLPALPAGMQLAALVALVAAARVLPLVAASLCAVVVSVAELLDSLLWRVGSPHASGDVLQALVYCTVFGAAPAALGQLLRSRARVAEQVLALRQSHERALRSERAAVEEGARAALAREMHDVVGHEMSLISVRTAALARRAPDADTRQEAELIRTVSLRALDEMRHLVRALREQRPEEASVPLGSRLADIPALVERSGLTVQPLTIAPGDGVYWPATVELAAYRTVQEALTNVLRHGDVGAPVALRVESVDGDTCLVVEVRSASARGTTGEAAPETTGGAASETSGGHGLTGLRERARILDGALAAGPTPDGSFLLRAAFPAPGHGLMGPERQRLTAPRTAATHRP